MEKELTVNQMEATPKDEDVHVERETPLQKFGPHPVTNKMHNFENEVKLLPFKFSLGDAPFTKE